jgi:hypothetical protein
MPNISDKLLALTRQLYPTGRAWKMPVSGTLEQLHIALSVSEDRAYNDAISILDSLLPDNDNFTTDDANDWERRLGIISNPLVPLPSRKLAIIRKMNQPGAAPAKSNWRYLQEQLQAAGFDVYVYENIFPYYYPDGDVTETPYQVTGGDTSFYTPNRYGQYRYGQVNYGGSYKKFVANHIDETRDWLFNIGSNLRSTFYIGGPTLGSFADVDTLRKDEFRQLILTIKPAQTVGFLLINYI